MTGRRLQMIAVATLIVGLTAALGIYLFAGRSTDDMIAYEIEHSKQYQRMLELYGGKANVLAVELTQWFDTLWRGTRLAYRGVRDRAAGRRVLARGRRRGRRRLAQRHFSSTLPDSCDFVSVRGSSTSTV